MSPRLWLLLFVLTLAVGVTVWMSGSKTATPTAEEVPAVTEEGKGEPPPAIPQPAIDPEPIPTVVPKRGYNDKRNDSNGLPGPNDPVPLYDTETPKPPEAAKPPNPDDPYSNAPVDGGASSLSGGSPPTSYPPPVYPDGGFEGDVPPPPGGDPGDGNPDGFGDGAPPMEEGF